MKKFLIVSAVFFGCAVLATVLTYVYIFKLNTAAVG